MLMMSPTSKSYGEPTPHQRQFVNLTYDEFIKNTNITALIKSEYAKRNAGAEMPDSQITGASKEVYKKRGNFSDWNGTFLQRLELVESTKTAQKSPKATANVITASIEPKSDMRKKYIASSSSTAVTDTIKAWLASTSASKDDTSAQLNATASKTRLMVEPKAARKVSTVTDKVAARKGPKLTADTGDQAISSAAQTKITANPDDRTEPKSATDKHSKTSRLRALEVFVRKMPGADKKHNRIAGSLKRTATAACEETTAASTASNCQKTELKEFQSAIVKLTFEEFCKQTNVSDVVKYGKSGYFTSNPGATTISEKLLLRNMKVLFAQATNPAVSKKWTNTAMDGLTWKRKSKIGPTKIDEIIDLNGMSDTSQVTENTVVETDPCKMRRQRKLNEVNSPQPEKDQPSTKKPSTKKPSDRKRAIGPLKEAPSILGSPKGTNQTIQHRGGNTITVVENRVIREATRTDANEKQNNAQSSTIETEEGVSPPKRRKQQQVPELKPIRQIKSVSTEVRFPRSEIVQRETAMPSKSNPPKVCPCGLAKQIETAHKETQTANIFVDQGMQYSPPQVEETNQAATQPDIVNPSMLLAPATMEALIPSQLNITQQNDCLVSDPLNISRGLQIATSSSNEMDQFEVATPTLSFGSQGVGTNEQQLVTVKQEKLSQSTYSQNSDVQWIPTVAPQAITINDSMTEDDLFREMNGSDPLMDRVGSQTFCASMSLDSSARPIPEVIEHGDKQHQDDEDPTENSMGADAYSQFQPQNTIESCLSEMGLQTDGQADSDVEMGEKSVLDDDSIPEDPHPKRTLPAMVTIARNSCVIIRDLLRQPGDFPDVSKVGVDTNALALNTAAFRIQWSNQKYAKPKTAQLTTHQASSSVADDTPKYPNRQKTQGRPRKTVKNVMDSTQVPKYDYPRLEFITTTINAKEHAQEVRARAPSKTVKTKPARTAHDDSREFFIEECESTQEDSISARSFSHVVNVADKDNTISPRTRALNSQNSIFLSSQLQRVLSNAEPPSDDQTGNTSDEEEIIHVTPDQALRSQSNVEEPHGSAVDPIALYQVPARYNNVDNNIEFLNYIDIGAVEIQLMGSSGARYNVGSQYNDWVTKLNFINDCNHLTINGQATRKIMKLNDAEWTAIQEILNRIRKFSYNVWASEPIKEGIMHRCLYYLFKTSSKFTSAIVERTAADEYDIRNATETLTLPTNGLDLMDVLDPYVLSQMQIDVAKNSK